MNGLIEGRVVHYVLIDGPHAGEHRKADVVRVWDPTTGLCNLIVALDGENDGATLGQLHRWVTSVSHDEETKKLGTWHWIERA